MKILFFFIFLLGITSCGKKSSESKSLTPYREEITPLPEQEYLKLVNNHRMGLGLVPLIYVGKIEQVSREHSFYMASSPNRFGHRGWRERCRRLKKEYNSINCGEIIARGPKSPSDLLDSWLASPSHRRMIEDPGFTHTGLGGVKSGEDIVFWTQMFLSINTL